MTAAESYDRSRMRVLDTVFFLFLASCAPAPEAALRTPEGMVRAHSLQQAEDGSRMLEELLPCVTAITRKPCTRTPDIWLDERVDSAAEAGHPTAYQFDGSDRIFVSKNTPEMQRFALAHELVHFTGADLPFLSETAGEGWCDWVALQCVPEARPNVVAARLSGARLAMGSEFFVLRFNIPEDPSRHSLTLAARQN